MQYLPLVLLLNTYYYYILIYRNGYYKTYIRMTCSPKIQDTLLKEINIQNNQ